MAYIGELAPVDENGKAIAAPKKKNTHSYKTELKKSQRDKSRMLVIALAGWSLAFVEFIIFLVVRSL
jgi:hypothetical protein